MNAATNPPANNGFSHEPVMIDEVLAALQPRDGGSYVDGVNSSTENGIDFDDVWDIYWATEDPTTC